MLSQTTAYARQSSTTAGQDKLVIGAYVWITERTIPLDEFVECPMANRSQCTLAAFICVLECISIGLQISDTHFFNFGVRFFSDFATEHVVVLIDAGSRGR